MKVFSRTPINLAEVTVPKGQVYLIPERCKGCSICIELCPREVLEESEGTNLKGYHYPEVVPGKEEDCVHCDFCTMVCPEFAIFTLEVEV
jgi:2-oxoglutarate ferredoxin oxidoreductase subunit delta